MSEALGHCAICNVHETLHGPGEANGTIRHKFSEHGDLVPVASEKKTQPNRIIAVPDPALRALLIEKGLITYDELAAKEAMILGRQRVPTTPSVDG